MEILFAQSIQKTEVCKSWSCETISPLHQVALVVGKSVLFIVLFLYYIYMALKGFLECVLKILLCFLFTGPKPLQMGPQTT